MHGPNQTGSVLALRLGLHCTCCWGAVGLGWRVLPHCRQPWGGCVATQGRLQVAVSRTATNPTSERAPRCPCPQALQWHVDRVHLH